MLTTQQLERLKHQLLRCNLKDIDNILHLETTVKLEPEKVRDDLIRGLDLLIWHRKGTME
jgi:hypothetical protein